jgi:hypothetical protein
MILIDYEHRKRRGKNLSRLLLKAGLGGEALGRRNYEAEVADAAQAGDDVPDEVEHRYLLVTVTYYSEQTDTVEAQSFDAPDDSLVDAMEEHLFQQGSPDYRFAARVFDLDAGVEVEWEEVREVRLALPETKEGPCP